MGNPTEKLREMYEREKARADAAIAAVVDEQRRFGEMQREAWKLEEALAAARRECDAAKDALARYGEHDSECPRHKTWNGVLAASQRAICSCGLSAALAAPAASEEGKR